MMGSSRAALTAAVLSCVAFSVCAEFELPPDSDPGYSNGQAWVDVNGDGRRDFCRIIGKDGRDGILACTLDDGAGRAGPTPMSPEFDAGARGEDRLIVDRYRGDKLMEFCRTIGEGGVWREVCTEFKPVQKDNQWSIVFGGSWEPYGISFLKVSSQDLPRVLPGEWIDARGIEFRAEATVAPCETARLEVEIVPATHDFTGQASHVGKMKTCGTSACLPAELPPVYFGPVAGRSYHAKVRMYLSRQTHDLDNGTVSCKGVPRARETPWLPYTDFIPEAKGQYPFINVRSEWLAPSDYPRDGRVEKGSSSDEMFNLSQEDGLWYAVKSTTTAPYEVEWFTSLTIADIDNVADGTLAIRSRSTGAACHQKKLGNRTALTRDSGLL
ncbi:hypothetical protein AB4Z46_31290 [Variovorax sp. M-6]|uniref:hypothetical protein n=1 Tax=Variovorax sp. M-6 TaxID=3233041 RepID=UPI003F97FC8D